MAYEKHPQTSKIVLFASKDIQVQGSKQYLVITDKAGDTHKIGDNRQKLWGLFNEARDAEPFLFIYESYNNIKYVAEVRAITDELLKRAVQRIGTELTDAQRMERNRSTALSYAKDLVIGGKEEPDKLYDRAKQNFDFIRGVSE